MNSPHRRFAFALLSIFAATLAAVAAPENTESVASNFSNDAAPLARELLTMSRENRAALTARVKQQIDAGKQALLDARAQAQRLDEHSRDEFKAAAEDVHTAERELNRALKAAESAEAWEHARASVAADFDVYIQAIARAQHIAAAGSATTRSDNSPAPR